VVLSSHAETAKEEITPRWIPHKLDHNTDMNHSDDVQGHESIKQSTNIIRSTLPSSKAARSLSFMNVSSKTSTKQSKEHDVFEIDEHWKTLSDKVETKEKKQHKGNVPSRRKPLLMRAFKCMFFRSPSTLSADRLHDICKTGDLLLLRQGTTFEGTMLAPGVVRGIRSTLDGKYMPKTRHLNLWTHVGVVVSLDPVEARWAESSKSGSSKKHVQVYEERVKCVLLADDRGITVTPLRDVLAAAEASALSESFPVCALRPLAASPMAANTYCTFADGLEELAALCGANSRCLTWGNIIDSAPEDSSSKQSSCFVNKKLITFGTLFLNRISAASFRPSEENMAEAARLFNMIYVSQESSHSDCERKVPTGALRSNMETLLKRSGGIADMESNARLEEMQRQMDSDCDGMISLDEFLSAFAALPSCTVPIEFDLPAIATAEMVATLYVSLGVLPEEYLQPNVYFHPQSFSSSSTIQKLKAVKPSGGFDTSSNCVISKATLKRNGIWFSDDILLKANRNV